MIRRRAHLRILEPHDVIAAVNRAGSDLLDPARHGYLEASESHWAPRRCLRCGGAPEDHHGLLWRMVARLVRRWRRG